MRLYGGKKFDVHLMADREVVRCRDVVVIVPVFNDDHDELLVIRNWRPAVVETLLEFPAGRLDHDDEPLPLAALRELGEETGYTAQELTPLGTFYTSPGFLTEKLHVFLATGLAPRHEGQQLSPTETITVERMGMEEMWQEIKAGRVQDAKTLAAIMLLAAHEEKRESEGSPW